MVPGARLTGVPLAAKNVQAVRLGKPLNLAEAGTMGEASPRAEADAFAAKVLPIVKMIPAEGSTTLRAIAAALNVRGVRTARGGRVARFHCAEHAGACALTPLATSSPNELTL
jgi:hypothetical protein